MRLQVFLSHNGVCSRRNAFVLIQQGRVVVNGQNILEPSTAINPLLDQILVDGKIIQTKKYDYVLLNKPAGCITTRKDRFAEKTVFDFIPQKFHHLVPAGRLDKDTEGLLLLTNDGDTVYRLTHPSFNIDKIYFVRVVGLWDEKIKEKIEKGVMIDGSKTAPAKIANVKILKNQIEATIAIHEGKKRQVRRMFEKFRLKVIYLKRLSQGPLTLGTLKAGEWRKLEEKEILKLQG